MKVVIYHADYSDVPYKRRPGIYKELTLLLKENVNSFGMSLIHLTTNGKEGWGDENYYFDLDPTHVNYNREICYIEFLKNIADENEVYWFTEPDWRIESVFPPLENDVDFLLRDDQAPLHPGWRLAKKSALSVFEEVLSCYDLNHKTWGGDSTGLRDFYNKFNRPSGTFKVSNCSVGLREYKKYGMQRSQFTQQFKADNKDTLIERYRKNDSR